MTKLDDLIEKFTKDLKSLQFEAHLNKCSETVRSWPEWKQSIVGPSEAMQAALKHIAELKAQLTETGASLTEAQASNRQLVEALTLSKKKWEIALSLLDSYEQHLYRVDFATVHKLIESIDQALTTPSAKRAQAEARVLAAAKEVAVKSLIRSDRQMDALDEALLEAVEALRAEEVKQNDE